MKLPGHVPRGNSSRMPFQAKRGIAGRHRKCPGNFMTVPNPICRLTNQLPVAIKKSNQHKTDLYIIRAKFIFVQYQPPVIAVYGPSVSSSCRFKYYVI